MEFPGGQEHFVEVNNEPLLEMPLGVLDLACDLYDPGRLSDNRTLTKLLCGFYFDEGVTPNLEHLVQSIIIDTTDAGILTKERAEYLERIGIGENLVSAYIFANDRAQLAANNFTHLIDLSVGPWGVVLASNAVALHTYKGKYRQNGRPYHDHVTEVAALVWHVFETMDRDKYDLSEELVTAAIAQALTHDSTEEWIPSTKYYRTGNTDVIKITPLVIQKIFQHFEHPYAYSAPKSQLVLTHETKIPWLKGYPGYLRRMASTRFSRIVKPADSLQNSSDPKPEIVLSNPPTKLEITKRRERLRRTKQYSRTISGLLLNIAGVGQYSWEREYYEIMQSINPHEMPDIRSKFEQKLADVAHSTNIGGHPN